METTYESMTIDTLKKAGEKMIKIIYKDEDFYFKTFIKEDSNQLIIHNNGAVDHTKRKPPVAQRSSWSEDIEVNCIFFDDKTIHFNDLNTGWGAGNIKRFYLEDYSAITKKVQELLSIKSKNVFYWGSSAGGYMSIILSSMHHQTSAIVNNPQTLLLNHYKGKIDKLLNAAFNGMSKEDAFGKYPERFSVVEAMKKYGYAPIIYYLQNYQFEFDMANHFEPFRKSLKEAGISEKENYYILYNDYERGHSPLSKEDTLQYIHKILDIK
ncbi:YqiA/YcfP family alpha/beta fold hydrolase [Salinicoccus carnicancri]|uniref:YqiA/YcfP family alpha/beta fold hydrolase n=1 Tax=Salinicoccus carnicancri TaxID=558170 RepID=UPI00047644CD|nr:YqiA/YcfP family alpha/beta fold hydrolase [Salinicoccus carnicancri]